MFIMSSVDQQFCCFICNKSFHYQTLLRQHMRCHTGEKPHVCVLCNQTFTQKSNLEKHVRIHTGERPFQCHFCQQSFTQKSNVDRHMRTHTGERPYSCHLCNRCFSQKSNVERHMKIHLESNPATLDSNVYSSETVLNQKTKDVFDKITNSLRSDHDNRDIENTIKPKMILDDTNKILSYRDQNIKNRILSQSNILCKKKTATPFQIKSNTSENDFPMKESNVEKFDSDSDLAKDKSSSVNDVSIHSDRTNSNTIINKHCIEMMPSPHLRLFWKKSNQTKSIVQLQKYHPRKKYLLQEKLAMTQKKNPAIDSEYLIGKNLSTKFIPQIKCQMSKPYQEIIERSDEDIDQPVSDHLEGGISRIKGWDVEKNQSLKNQLNPVDDKMERFDEDIGNIDQPVSDYLEDGFSRIKGSCCDIEKNQSIKIQQNPVEDKMERFDEDIGNIDPPISDCLKDGLSRIKGSCCDIQKDQTLKTQQNLVEEKMESQAETENPVHDQDSTMLKCKNIFEKTNLMNVSIKQISNQVQVDDDYQCPMCMKTFAHKCNIGKHMLLHAGIKPYRCITCGKAFSQKCNAQRHMKTHDHQLRLHSEGSAENISVLEKCRIKNTIEMQPKKELEKINSKPCNDFSSIGNSILKESSTDLAKGNFYLEESSNDEDFSSSTESRRSRDDTIHRKPFKCGFCLAVFPKLTELSEHIRIHKEKYLSNKLQESTKDVSLNNKIYTDTKPSSPDLSLSCEYCGHKFLEFLELSKHKEVCHLENKAELSEHGLIQNEKYFSNESHESTKDVNFQSVNNRIYTNTKPSCPDLSLSCEYCGHRFLDLWELSKHEELCHLENKAYTCKPCKSIILGTNDYLIHLKKFHKKQMIPTGVC